MVSLKKIENLNIILLSLLPLALAAGPAIIEIVVFINILLFIISKKKIRFDKSDFFIIIFYLYLILSSLLSNFKIDSLMSSILLLRFIFLYYIFKYYFLSESRFKIINLTLITLIFTFTILIIDGYSQYFLKSSIFGNELSEIDRMTMHFRKDEYIMGSYLSKMMPIFLGVWFFKYKSFNLKINIFLSILLIFTFICMVLSNDRSATYLIIFFIFGLIILSNLKLYFKIVTFFVVLFSITFSIFLIPSIKDRYLSATFMELLGKNDDLVSENVEILKNNNSKLNFFNLNINNNNIYFFSTAHEAHIKTSLNMYLKNPLFGIGPNNFRKLCSKEDYGIYEERGCSTHPHHILSQVLAETGTLGLLFYLIAFFYLLKNLFKQLMSKYKNFYLSNIYLFYLLLLMPLLPSGNIFNNWYIYSITLPFLYLKLVK